MHDMQEDARSTQHVTDAATWINTRGMTPSPIKLASVASSVKGQWQSDRRNYAVRTTVEKLTNLKAIKPENEDMQRKTLPATHSYNAARFLDNRSMDWPTTTGKPRAI